MSDLVRTRAEWSGEALDRAFAAPPEEYVFYLLLQANRRREAALAAALQEIGLTVPKWHAGAVIRRLGGCSMTEVSHLSAVDRTTLSRTIDRMVRDGLVLRAVSSNDRRRVHLSLSARGVELIDRARAVSRALNRRILQDVPEDHRIATLRLLQQVVGVLIDDDDVAQGVLTYRAISQDARP